MTSTPSAAGSRPPVLLGHGGGQHKKAPGLVARAHRYVTACGFAVAAAFRSVMNWIVASPAY